MNSFKIIIIILFSWLLLNCDEESLEVKIITFNFESTHYNYYSNIEDTFILDTIWMEKHYNWATTKLEINPLSKLNYYKYLNRQHLFEITGKNANGFAELNNWNFHSIGHPEGHENIHTLVINEIGHPPALFNEGIAVAFAPQPIYGFGVFKDIPTWNGQSIDKISKKLKNNNEIPEINVLLESVEFFKYTTNNTYPLSGSFCKYLIKEYSINKLKSFYKLLTFKSSSEFTKIQFIKIYNIELEQVWKDWKEQL